VAFLARGLRYVGKITRLSHDALMLPIINLRKSHKATNNLKRTLSVICAEVILPQHTPYHASSSPLASSLVNRMIEKKNNISSRVTLQVSFLIPCHDHDHCSLSDASLIVYVQPIHDYSLHVLRVCLTTNMIYLRIFALSIFLPSTSRV